MKKFLEKFFYDAYFGKSLFEMEKLGEKIFRKVVPLFFGSIFWGKIFLTGRFFGGHFLKPIFWGKKFVTNCSPFIGKKPRGPVGEGVQGEYRVEYPGLLAGYCGDFLRCEGHTAHLSDFAIGFRLTQHLELGKLALVLCGARPFNLRSTATTAFAIPTIELRNEFALFSLGFNGVGKVAEKLGDVVGVGRADTDEEEGEI